MLKITDPLLIKLAGEKAFVKGQKLLENGAVYDLHKFKNHISATVDGTKTYHVDLTHTQSTLEGACDCPASDRFDFCKHCVAVALFLQIEQQLFDETLNPSTPNQKPDLIFAYLQTLSKEVLQTALLETIKNDRTLQAHWLVKAEIVLDCLDYKSLRKKITAAIPYNRHLYAYHDVRQYFAKASTLIEQIQGSQDKLTAEERFKLAEYALQRLNKALETIDDSGGYRFDSVEFFSDLMVESFSHLTWSIDKKVDWFFKAMQATSDILPPTAPLFWPSLTDAERSLIHQKSQAIWNSLPMLKSVNSNDYDTIQYYEQLRDILVETAEIQGQFSEVIALYDKTATGFYDDLSILKRMLEYKMYEVAEKRLVDLRTKYTDHQNRKQLLNFEVELAQTQTQFTRMLELRWQHFTYSLDLEDLKTLIHQANQHQDETDWQSKAEQFLLERTQKKAPKRNWGWNPYENLLAYYLTFDHPQQALKLLNDRVIGDHHTMQILRQKALSYTDILPHYKVAIEKCINQSNNDSYHDAITYMQELLQRAPSEQERIPLKEWLQTLRKQYKIKRNFAGWFDQFWLATFGE
jgi:uncharacterized Zn finger protein